jgi:diguanylate cyclase (GGDEF)-like protein
MELINNLLKTTLDNLPSTAVVIINQDLNILFCNKVLFNRAHTLHTCRNLNEILQLKDSDINDILDDNGTGYIRIAVKPDFRSYNFKYFSVEHMIVLIGELEKTTETDVISQMSLNTNDMANLSRQLRSKNRELEIANTKISQLVREDSLTGLNNRRVFYEAYETNSSLALRHQNPFSIIMCDIDNFKSVNDTYGHGVGDLVLKGFANILMSNTRKEDVLIRYGGEEFIILLPYSKISEAKILAEKIRVKFEHSEIIKDRVITASFGLSQWKETDSVDTLVKRADDALYEAKKSGKNTLILH